MSERPVIPVRPVAGKPSAEAVAQQDRLWRWRYLMLAPHRLGFFLAMVLLVASGAWWTLVQVSRVSSWPTLAYSLSPSVVHAAAMVFGFIPLFFSGFLFTAGPKWLGVEPWPTRTLRAPLVLQAVGWLTWLAGAHLSAAVCLLGAALAWLGLTSMGVLFWRLVLRSRAEDQVHARAIGVATIVGSLSLLGLCASLVWDAQDTARVFVLTGLWGFVLVVYVTVAHRMIPFFTSSAMPLVTVFRPLWLLWLMLGAAAFEAAAVWVEFEGPLRGPVAPVWMLLRGVLELGVGAVLLWLAGCGGWCKVSRTVCWPCCTLVFSGWACPLCWPVLPSCWGWCKTRLSSAWGRCMPSPWGAWRR